MLTQELSVGSLLTMAVGCQQALKHRIPRIRSKVGARYSISFRKCVSSLTNKRAMDSVEHILASPIVPNDVDLSSGFLDNEESDCLINEIKSFSYFKLGNPEVYYAEENSGANKIPDCIKEVRTDYHVMKSL